MNRYKYIAKDSNNTIYKGIISSKDIDELREILSYKKLYLLSSKKIEKHKLELRDRIRTQDLSFLCNQFSIMLSSGIELTKVISIIKESNKDSKRIKEILEEVLKDISSGMSLSSSLERFNKDFPNHFISMIKVGEASGRLDIIFKDLSKYYEKQKVNKQKLISALSYPLVLIGLGLLVVIFLFIKIIPIFTKIFDSFNSEVPSITRFVLNLSSHFKSYYYIYLFVIVLLLALFLIFKNKKKVRYFLDYIKLKLPLIKELYKSVYTIHFIQGMDILIKSGMDISSSVNLTSDLLNNEYLKKKLQNASDDIKIGISITSSISNINYFSDLFIEMLDIGEQSGDMNSILITLYDYYNLDYDYRLKKLIGTIEPILIIMIGGMIAFMLLSIFLPMLGIMNSMETRI